MKYKLESLTAFVASLPGVIGKVGSGSENDGRWWVKFTLNLEHPLAWNVVQELGHVLNYLDEDRLPTVFMPVSPPPYMNGGPKDYLSWVIENRDSKFSPDDCLEWLEGRLPRPVTDLSKWAT
jgi:hypothetical protein